MACHQRGARAERSLASAVCICLTVIASPLSGHAEDYTGQTFLETSETTYNTTKTLFTLTAKLDGRATLLKKISFAKNIKVNFLKPIAATFEAVEKTPLGKAVKLIGAGVDLLKVEDEFLKYYYGKSKELGPLRDSIVGAIADL